MILPRYLEVLNFSPNLVTVILLILKYIYVLKIDDVFT